MAGIDQASLDLIIQLQLQDVQALSLRSQGSQNRPNKGKGKGKGRQYDPPPDQDLAMQLYRAELESLNAFLADRAMSQSIARAVVQDADAIAEEVRPQEQQGHGNDGEDGLDPVVLARLQALYMDDGSYGFDFDCGCGHEDDGVPGDQPESSSWAASRRHPASTPAPPKGLFGFHGALAAASAASAASAAAAAGRAATGSAAAPAPARGEPRRTCTACSDPFPLSSTTRCPCSHDYCRGCIARLFSAALRDESLFPPRCCGQPIPLDADRARFLPRGFQDEFRAKQVEYGTPNRTYCHTPTCSAFIPAHNIRGDRAGCSRCGALTCTTCKGAAHGSLDCPEDAATQELLRVAGENGWQRCRACRRMVELNLGCNHITCLCGAQFCYVCGSPWKTCDCPQWDEDRLVERAIDVVHRDADAAHLDAAQQERAVRRVRRDLQDYHNCEAHRWRTRGGRFRCEECRQMLPQYIYECEDCRILACRRCRYNRL